MIPKEDLATRKSIVISEYLKGENPERIANSLQIPEKIVKRDLGSMKITNLEEAKKSEEQYLEEIKQEIEIIRREGWKLYYLAKTGEEKLNILREMRGTLSKKAELLQQMRLFPLVSDKKELWNQTRENILIAKDYTKPIFVRNLHEEKPTENLRLINNSGSKFILG